MSNVTKMEEDNIPNIDVSELFGAKPDEVNADEYPAIQNLSSAFFYQFVPCPKSTYSPEFVYLPYENYGPKFTEESVQLMNWNLLWEAGHIRPEFFEEKLPGNFQWLKKYEGHNIYLLPFTQSHRYYAYSSLYHLLPQRTLKRFGLPLLQKGTWPNTIPDNRLEHYLPMNFDSLLEKAVASHVWPLICSGSRLAAFDRTDPIRILAHNLDFWLPHIFKTVENRLKSFGRVEFENDEQIKLFNELAKQLPEDVKAERPLRGGFVWMGEEDAWEATQEMVNLADENGKLREIIDAVKSNRVEDDFSERWSYAREDFERKLYRKRTKIKVSFVELKDTIPVHGPESEVHEKLLWENFMALLDYKEKRIVVCLRNGNTRVGEISKMLGYANHSPVSKALSKIRKKALSYLEL